VFGFPPGVLQSVADYVHGGLNNPINTYDIQSGINAALMRGQLNVVPVGYSGR
jgi:hypothetical protein